jgi:hypothetical protein
MLITVLNSKASPFAPKKGQARDDYFALEISVRASHPATIREALSPFPSPEMGLIFCESFMAVPAACAVKFRN